MALTPPTQMMPPMRTPVVGNSLQQLAAMRANRGQVPALGNVQPMRPMPPAQSPALPMNENTSEVIKEGAFNAAFETLAKKAGVNIIEGVRDVQQVQQQQQVANLEEAAMKNAAIQRLMMAANNRNVAMQSGGLISMAEGGDLKIAEGGEFSGRVPGDGHGMEDNVYMPIKEGKEQVATLAVSPSEYVVDSYTMAALGNGNTDEGADVMDEAVKQIRKKAYGSEKQPNEISGLAALKPLIERV